MRLTALIGARRIDRPFQLAILGLELILVPKEELERNGDADKSSGG